MGEFLQKIARHVVSVSGALVISTLPVFADLPAQPSGPVPVVVPGLTIYPPTMSQGELPAAGMPLKVEAKVVVTQISLISYRAIFEIQNSTGEVIASNKRALRSPGKKTLVVGISVSLPAMMKDGVYACVFRVLDAAEKKEIARVTQQEFFRIGRETLTVAIAPARETALPPVPISPIVETATTQPLIVPVAETTPLQPPPTPLPAPLPWRFTAASIRVEPAEVPLGSLPQRLVMTLVNQGGPFAPDGGKARMAVPLAWASASGQRSDWLWNMGPIEIPAMTSGQSAEITIPLLAMKTVGYVDPAKWTAGSYYLYVDHPVSPADASAPADLMRRSDGLLFARYGSEQNAVAGGGLFRILAPDLGSNPMTIEPHEFTINTRNEVSTRLDGTAFTVRSPLLAEGAKVTLRFLTGEAGEGVVEAVVGGVFTHAQDYTGLPLTQEFSGRVTLVAPGEVRIEFSTWELGFIEIAAMAEYELPVDWEVTNADNSSQRVQAKFLIFPGVSQEPPPIEAPQEVPQAPEGPPIVIIPQEEGAK